MWMSDLGLTIDIKGNGPAPEGIRAWTVTDFKRVEPDPTLFEIPAEYLPGRDPLLNAKTVFVENETGDPEVKDTAERDFNSWKTMTHLRPFEREEASQGWRRITVVAAKEKADIIAVFTSVRNDDDASILPAMEMKMYALNSDEPLFTHHWASNPNFKIQDELSRYTRDMVGGCVIALLNRLENTRIGLINPPHQTAQPQPDQARLTENPRHRDRAGRALLPATRSPERSLSLPGAIFGISRQNLCATIAQTTSAASKLGAAQHPVEITGAGSNRVRFIPRRDSS